MVLAGKAGEGGVSLKDSWFKFFTNNWRAGTHRLSLEERGLYVGLIVLWRDGQRVPNDADWIAREIGLRNRRTVERVLAALLARGKVYVDGSWLYNSKVEDDLQARAEQRANKPAATPARDQTVLRFPPRVVHNHGEN